MHSLFLILSLFPVITLATPEHEAKVTKAIDEIMKQTSIKMAAVVDESTQRLYSEMSKSAKSKRDHTDASNIHAQIGHLRNELLVEYHPIAYQILSEMTDYPRIERRSEMPAGTFQRVNLELTKAWENIVRSYKPSSSALKGLEKSFDETTQKVNSFNLERSHEI